MCYCLILHIWIIFCWKNKENVFSNSRVGLISKVPRLSRANSSLKIERHILAIINDLTSQKVVWYHNLSCSFSMQSFSSLCQLHLGESHYFWNNLLHIQFKTFYYKWINNLFNRNPFLNLNSRGIIHSHKHTDNFTMS